MDYDKVSFEDTLAKNVLATGKCVGCGACVLVCPFNCLEYVKEKPSLVKKCEICGVCAQACPKYNWSWSEAENFVFNKKRSIEEKFGIYRRLVVAKAKDGRIFEASQNGGIVTALLLFALKNRLIDGAIVSGTSKQKPFLPIPKLATTFKEILECAGTRYFYSPNVLALAQVDKQKKVNVAFVGTPCHINAIRRMQISSLKEYTSPLKILIGLMCSECFTYEDFLNKQIQQKLGLNSQKIKKISIKGKVLLTTESGTKILSLNEARKYARKSCYFCCDFSSELADISAGDLGLHGWTFTIIRTDKGEELFSRAEKAGVIKTRKADREMDALKLLNKLSEKKKRVLTK